MRIHLVIFLNIVFYSLSEAYRCICNYGPAYQIHGSRDPNGDVIAVAYPYDCFLYLGTEGAYWKTKVNSMYGWFWIVGYNEPHITDCSNPIRDIGNNGDCLLVTVNTNVFSRPVSSSHYVVNSMPPCRQKSDCPQLLDGDSFYENGHPWYRIKYDGAVGYARADNDYVMRWHCGFPAPSHAHYNGRRSNTGSGGSSGHQQIQVVYVTQPPPKVTQPPPTKAISVTTKLPYINPNLFPVCSHSKVTFSVESSSLEHPSSATCPDGTHSSKEAFVLNACSAPSISQWHKGPKVMDYCSQIPKYTPVATFVHFGLYNPTDDRSGIGVFISCEGNGFMMVLQLCGMSPTTVHVDRGDSDFVSNADNYHVIQWQKP